MNVDHERDGDDERCERRDYVEPSAQRSACPVVILQRGATEKTEALLADAEAHAAGQS